MPPEGVGLAIFTPDGLLQPRKQITDVYAVYDQSIDVAIVYPDAAQTGILDDCAIQVAKIKRRALHVVHRE
jgi:hypothetical protein